MTSDKNYSQDTSKLGGKYHTYPTTTTASKLFTDPDEFHDLRDLMMSRGIPSRTQEIISRLLSQSSVKCDGQTRRERFELSATLVLLIY